MVPNDQAVATLNELIQTCKDGELGFKAAADGVANPQMKSAFLEYSQQRADMARALQDEVRRLGGDPPSAGSMSGAIHRGWFNIKSVVTGRDDHAIAAEAERGEDVAKSAYAQALNTSLPATAHMLVHQQAAKVREAHDRVRAFRDQVAT